MLSEDQMKEGNREVSEARVKIRKRERKVKRGNKIRKGAKMMITKSWEREKERKVRGQMTNKQKQEMRNEKEQK